MVQLLRQWFLIGMFLLPHAALAADRCTELMGTCAYYTCIESTRLSCGDEGYALNYGQVYCERLSALQFSETTDQLTRAVWPDVGNSWRDGVRMCLQRELEEFFATSGAKQCATLRSFAFGSHPKCYTAGPSFCALPPEDVIAVGINIDPATLLSAEGLTQIADTAAICAEYVRLRLRSPGDDPVIAAQLQFNLAIWELMLTKAWAPAEQDAP